MADERLLGKTSTVRQSENPTFALSDAAATSKHTEIGGRVDTIMKEDITVFFLSPCDRPLDDPVLTQPHEMFIPALSCSIDMETTSNALVPRIAKNLGIPDVCNDFFSLYVYFEGQEPRPLGPEELVLPSLVWMNPMEHLEAKSEEGDSSSGRKIRRKSSVKERIRSMSFGKLMSGMGKGGKSASRPRKSMGNMASRESAVVGYDVFGGDSSEEDGDDEEGFESLLEGKSHNNQGLVKLVFKIRLFLNYAIMRIDPLGIIDMKRTRYKSNFRRLLFFQVEKYISDEKWPLEREKLAKSLPALIGLSMASKFGMFATSEYDRMDIYAHTQAIYGEVYSKCSKNGALLTQSMLENFWREASVDYSKEGTAALANIDWPYESCFHKLVFKVYGGSYGCEVFPCTIDSGGTDQKYVLGVNDTGLLIISATDLVVKTTIPFEHIIRWGHIPGKYFYYHERGTDEEKETRIYTPKASEVSSLLKEYAVALMNVELGRYTETGITKASLEAKGHWKKAGTLLKITRAFGSSNAKKGRALQGNLKEAAKKEAEGAEEKKESSETPPLSASRRRSRAPASNP
eukprot:CAMPEP_0182476316 /NCGR_PEP_ID=MMETSP1319-20130603/28831_1 /TAXON_ID=172717 /ORGANISM="Bolidomonas pacifica, Strain RCC208" /LENGTH=572 /DNA_ID=CAMNT_0024677395 /DNA_START=298 /DNA_END=2013 /DNA_ORIENTATION=+